MPPPMKKLDPCCDLRPAVRRMSIHDIDIWAVVVRENRLRISKCTAFTFKTKDILWFLQLDGSGTNPRSGSR
jgi:hypothetical protein